MRAKAFIVEHFDTGVEQIGNTPVDIRIHAIDQLEARHVPVSTAREILRRTSLVVDKLRKINAPLDKFWVYDEYLEISLGMFFRENGTLVWATSIIGRPRHLPGQGRYPDYNLNEL